jgi:hypothetical protein
MEAGMFKKALTNTQPNITKTRPSTIAKPPNTTKPAITRKQPITLILAHGHTLHAAEHAAEAAKLQVEQHAWPIHWFRNGGACSAPDWARSSAASRQLYAWRRRYVS